MTVKLAVLRTDQATHEAVQQAIAHFSERAPAVFETWVNSELALVVVAVGKKPVSGALLDCGRGTGWQRTARKTV